MSFDLGITRNGNINVWPVFKKFKNEEKKELQLLYPFFSEKENYRLHTKHFQALPFYINDSTPKATDKRYFSFYYPSVYHFHQQNDSTGKTSTMKFAELAPYISLLDVSRSSSGVFLENNIFFFLWYKRNISEGKTHLVVFPVYWYFVNRTDTTQFFFPLYYQKKGIGDRKINAAFFYNYHKTIDKKTNSIFPFWWNSTRYYPHDTVRKNTLFPVYWSTRSNDRNNTIIFPLLYSFKNQFFRSQTLFPFFSYGKTMDSSQSYLAITPLAWRIKTKEETDNILFPLFWNRKQFYKNDTVNKVLLLPFLRSVRSKNVNSDIFFPFIYSYKDNYQRSLTLFPLFSYGQTTDSSRSHLAVTPFFWQFKTKESFTDFLVPFLWQHKDYLKDDTINKTVVFPLLWSTKSKNKYNDVLFPFVYSFKNEQKRSLIVFPLFASGTTVDSSKSFFGITPAYWHFQTKTGSGNILFPVFWNTKEYLTNDTITKNTVLPVLWTERSRNKNYTVLFPFVFSYKNQFRKSLTVLPLFSYGHTNDFSKSHYAITPVYWHFKTRNSYGDILFPIFLNYKKYQTSDTIRTTIAFPLFWSVKSNYRNNTVLFPFIFSFQNKKKYSLTVLPLFSYGRKYDGRKSYIGVTPFFWHVETKYGIKNILFPIVWNHTQYLYNDTTNKTVVFPLLWSYRSKEKNSDVLFPFVFSYKDKYKHSLTFFPLFSFGRVADSSQSYLGITPLFWHIKTKQDEINFLFPFIWHNKEFLKEDTIFRIRIFPVLWSTRSKNNNSDVLFPFVYSFKEKDKRSLTIFPLFSYGRREYPQQKYLVATPLFWHFETMQHASNLLIPFFWNRKKYLQDDTLHNTWIFPLCFFKKSKNVNNFFLFPLVFKVKNEKRKHFTLFPLVSFGHSASGDKRYIMLTPLFGSFHSLQKTNTFLFPLFSYRKSGDEKDITALLFLYRKTVKTNYSRTSFLWPICERLKYENHNSFRFAPFVWMLKTDSSKMFSIQPFFYSYKSNSKNIFVLNWFLYKRENLKGISVSNSILWQLYYSKHNANGDFENRFLHLVYANIKEQGRREKSLLPFYHSITDSDGNKSVSVFFSFYNHFREYKPIIKDFYEEERIFWFIRWRSNYKQLKSEGKGDFNKRGR